MSTIEVTHSVPDAEPSQQLSLQDQLSTVLRSGDPRVQRLHTAGVSVCFAIEDAPDQSATLLLDRNPPAVEMGKQPADISIAMWPEQAEQMALGELSLPVELYAGRVAYRGPIRRYLTIDPVLRGLLAGASRPNE